MRPQLISITFLFISYWSIAQNKKHNEWSVSVPIVWSKAEITNVYGPSRQIGGSAWSYGVNTFYSRIIYKGLFAKTGLGYFKQSFGIQRPFDYPGPTQPLYTTRSYHYHSWHFIIGLGYLIELEKTSSLKSTVTYNIYQSFKQTYKPQTQNPPLVNKDQFHFGRSVIFSAGFCQKVDERISLGLDLLLPVYTRWRMDKQFRENTNEYYGPEKIIGLAISGSYKF